MPQSELLAAKPVAAVAASRPSWWWAVLHNYLYFLALGLAIPVLPPGSVDVDSAIMADGAAFWRGE